MEKNEILEKAKKINEKKALTSERLYKQICEEEVCLKARICPECGGKLDYDFSIENNPPSKYYKCNDCDYDYGIKPSKKGPDWGEKIMAGRIMLSILLAIVGVGGLIYVTISSLL